MNNEESKFESTKLCNIAKKAKTKKVKKKKKEKTSM